MAIKSGFFNSVDGDRTYDAEDIGNYFNGLISNGVFESVGNKLVVTAASGMAVNIDSGRAFINSHWMSNDSIVTLSLAASDVQYKRIDAIVIRLDISDGARSMGIYVKQGTNSLNPTAPALTRDETVYEICLAQIYINNNVTSISQSNITDTRANTNLCGFVTGLINQVDTSDLFLQYQTAYADYYANSTAAFDAYMASKKAAFETWFENLTSTLNVNTTLVKYQNSVLVTAETSEIPLGISQYETGDILLVHINGVLFVEGSEYTVSGEGENAKITLTNTIKSNNTVTFICIKSVIGNAQIYIKEEF